MLGSDDRAPHYEQGSEKQFAGALVTLPLVIRSKWVLDGRVSGIGIGMG